MPVSTTSRSISSTGSRARAPPTSTRDLAEALALAPEHLSCYELEAKPGTRFTHAHGEELETPGGGDGGLLRARRRDADGGRLPLVRDGELLPRATAAATSARTTTWATGAGATTSASGSGRSRRSAACAGATLPRSARYLAALGARRGAAARGRAARRRTKAVERLMLGLRLDEPLALARARARSSTATALERLVDGGLVERGGAAAIRLTPARAAPRRRRHRRAARVAWSSAAHTMHARMESDAARKREILRRVVEEYVATGQPVGSKSLVERPGLDVSSSTVRSELAELEALGLLTHPHTSAGRVPDRERLPRLRRGARRRDRGAPGAVQRSTSATMRNELEEALRQTTEALSRGDAPPGARLRAVARGGRGAPRRGAPAAAARRDHRRDHGVGRRLEAGLRVRGAVDPGSSSGLRAYLDETVVGKRPSPTVVRRAFEDPALTTRERLFLETRAAGIRRARGGGDRPLRRRRRGSARRRARRRARGLSAPARGARAPRRGALAPAGRARPQAAGDPSRAGARGRGAARRRRTSAPPTVSRTARSARSACSARCGWTTRRRSAPCAPLRSSCRGWSTTSTAATDGDGGAGLLRAARRLARREPCGDQAAHSAVSRASSIPT